MAEVKFNTVSYLRNHFKGVGTVFVTVTICYIILGLPFVAANILSQVFVDDILSGHNPGWANGFFLFAILTILIEFSARMALGSTWFMTTRISLNASAELLWHLLRLPLSFFGNKYAGSISTILSYPSKIASNMRLKMLSFTGDVLVAVLYLFLMMRYSLALSLFALAHTLLSVHVMKVSKQQRHQLNSAMQSSFAELSGYTTSSISNIEAIKGSAAEYGFIKRWIGYMSKTQNASVKCSSKNIYLESLPLIVKSVADVFVLGLGAKFIMNGEMTTGMLLAFQGFLSTCATSLVRTDERLQVWSNISAQGESVGSILNEKCELSDDFEDNTPYEDGKLHGNLEMIDVSFGYDREAGPLISHFNLKLEPGKSVAFVGPSGCGKSTLTKLISGLYKPWSGEILFDGKKQSEINRSVFSSSISVVDQNIVLFDGTVADNVRMWDDSVEDFAMVFACNDAQIHAAIASKEKAYDTVIENGGMNFSGGQRQRIEIASALAKEPVIMIMDEGTSALDPLTEEMVIKNIKAMGISLIMIAHRLSTIRDCDEIIVLEHGKISERGSHEQLIKNDGLYKRLMESE